MKKTKNEVLFETRDALCDMSKMLQLVDQTIGAVEAPGEDIAIKGSSTILWNIITQMAKMEEDLVIAMRGV